MEAVVAVTLADVTCVGSNMVATKVKSEVVLNAPSLLVKNLPLAYEFVVEYRSSAKGTLRVSRVTVNV